MPTWQQEMGWHCSTCKALNRGRHKTCQNCGKAKEDESFVDLPTEGKGREWAVTDPTLLMQAKAGPDWECTYCQSHQRRDDGACANCGASQGDSTQDSAPRTSDLDALLDAAVSRQVEIREKPRTPRAFSNKLTEALTRGGAKIPGLLAGPTPKKPWRPSKRVKWALCAVLAIAVLGTLAYFLLRTRIVDARVERLHWQHQVSVERYQVLRDEGFAEDRPLDAFNVIGMGDRHHHNIKVADGEEPYQDQEACGTTPRICTTIPGTCSTTPVTCTSNGNGFQTCSGGDTVCSPASESCSGGETQYCSVTKYRTKYRDESVRATWYSWNVWRWKYHRKVSESGATAQTSWPTPQKIGLNQNLGVGEKERETRKATYKVVFRDTEGDEHTVVPGDLREFQSFFPVGKSYRLKVRFGHAEVYQGD